MLHFIVMEYPVRHELVFSLDVGADIKEQKKICWQPSIFCSQRWAEDF